MEDLSFAEPLPPAFRRTVTVLQPATSRPYNETEWRDALVVVEKGEMEVECLAGGRRAFREGDVLFLSGLSLRAMHNRGAEPAVLVAVSRARPDDFRAAGRSHG